MLRGKVSSMRKVQEKQNKEVIINEKESWSGAGSPAEGGNGHIFS